jgi:glycosyltransferase involved in cell wall biosynthesis
MSLVSILLCTMDRYELTRQCVPRMLENAGWEYELLSVDNGSTDPRVPELIAQLDPVWHRTNGRNEGYARMMNEMLLHAKGDFFCQIDNDFSLPEGWLAKLVECHKAVPRPGISGWHLTRFELAGAQAVNGVTIYPGDVFGVKFFARSLMEEIGFLREYAEYGEEDRNYLLRSTRTGHLNYYVGTGAEHLGEDSGEKSPYRQFKWDCLAKAAPLREAEAVELAQTGNYYLPVHSDRYEAARACRCR